MRFFYDFLFFSLSRLQVRDTITSLFSSMKRQSRKMSSSSLTWKVRAMKLRWLGLERAVEELALEAERMQRVRRIRTRKQQVTSSDNVNVHDGLDDFRIWGCLVFIITKIMNEFCRWKRRKLIGSVFGLCNKHMQLLKHLVYLIRTSIATSNEKVTLAGYYPVPEDFEPWRYLGCITHVNGLLVIIWFIPSTTATVENAQQLPHWTWSLTGATTPFSLQFHHGR